MGLPFVSSDATSDGIASSDSVLGVRTLGRLAPGPVGPRPSHWGAPGRAGRPAKSPPAMGREIWDYIRFHCMKCPGSPGTTPNELDEMAEDGVITWVAKLVGEFCCLGFFLLDLPK